MALRSITFKDDQALQRCLLHDSAHVVPGAAGPHVARIQTALLLLDRARITPAELYAKLYGPTTTAAVLEYKRKRKIINFSYQKQADNIVGKMTIARLDEEIVQLERGTASRAVCPGGGPPGTQALPIATARLAPAALNVAEGKNVAPKKHNKQFRLVFQATSLGEALGGLFKLPALIRRAKVLMTPHGFSFADEVPRIGPTIPHDLLVDVHFDADTFGLREKSLAVMAGFDKVLRVIFCPFAEANPYFGSTHGGKLVPNFPEVPKFVLINTSKSHADEGTLLHEMIHASFLGPSPQHERKNLRSVYSEAESGRDQLTDPDAESLASAYFR